MFSVWLYFIILQFFSVYLQARSSHFFLHQNGIGAGEMEGCLKPHQPAVDFLNDSAVQESAKL